MHHRLKNNLAILNAMFDWKIKESSTNKIIDVLKEMKSRVKAISSLHELLYQSNIYGEVNISKYISSIIRNTSSLLINNKIEFKTIYSKKINLSIQKALPVGLIVHEFITNSIKYAFENKDKGIIEIEWNDNLNESIFSLKDNGIGCENIESLKGSSIGLEMIRLLIKQLDAKSIWNGVGGVSLQIYLKKADL
ncbi:MAG: sensor histidine kinase [Silvanigrellaceae bacterium]|nr:sensor histidine kinase [Silvanigrellaceae bacterium]